MQRRTALKLATVVASLALAWPAAAADTIKIGLVTALSGQSAKAGEAITRGLTIAIDELNAEGGVLGGRKFELVRRDDEANPAKGQIAARELIFKEKVAVLFGGLDSPVALAIVPIVNQEKVPFMDPWAAGTPITRNGANPNFAFRVSAMDELVDRAMLQYAQKHYNTKSPGVIVVNNPWGESNQKGLIAALNEKGVKPAGVEKFEPNDVDVTPQLSRLKTPAPTRSARRQRRPVGAGREIARPDGMESADRVALGPGWRPLHRARGSERQGRRVRADLQLLRQAVAGRRARARCAEEEVSRCQGSG
jgi:branched-chain amino acid transport system substrate-binding protein